MKTIPLTQGQFALIDDPDFEALSKFKWFACKRKHGFYAARYEGRKFIMMHQEILQVPKGIEVDHKNGDELDNQRDNLRAATKQQNARAFRTLNKNKSSKYRGVSWEQQTRKWKAQITISGKTTSIGRYDVQMKAALAYDQAALRHFGEFVHLNFPDLTSAKVVAH